jgi:hypothetical protein
MWLHILLVCLASALSVGCPTTGFYQPNDRLVETLGMPQAKQRLQETVLRSVNPQIVEADVTNEFLQYRYRQAIAGFPTGAILEHRVFFVNAVRIDVFANNVVNVWTAGNHLMAQLIFGNFEDARTFADLMASFRGQRGSGAR